MEYAGLVLGCLSGVGAFATFVNNRINRKKMKRESEKLNTNVENLICESKKTCNNVETIMNMVGVEIINDNSPFEIETPSEHSVVSVKGVKYDKRKNEIILPDNFDSYPMKI